MMNSRPPRKRLIRATAACACVAGRGLGESLRVDADRIGAHQRGHSEHFEPAVAQIAGIAIVDQVAGQIGDVVLGLQADDVIGAKRAGDPLMLRQGLKDVGRRERDMQEEPGRPLDPGAAEAVAHQQEMVVVHPDLILGAGLVGDQIGDALVDMRIDVEGAGIEMRQIEAAVEHRPGDAIGEVDVEAIIFVAGQVGEDEFDPLVLQPGGALGRFVDQIAGPADPDAAATISTPPRRQRPARRPGPMDRRRCGSKLR